MTERDWRREAICRGKTALFFPGPYEGPCQRDRREHAAIVMCVACPVMLECRTFARRTNQSGVWGGEADEARARGRTADKKNRQLVRRDQASDSRRTTPAALVGSHAAYSAVVVGEA
jgi:WhiB family transcriptional regulator, redox-sensing transcriptional regulator